MPFSTKFLLSMGIISGLSIYNSSGKEDKQSRDLNKNNDKKNDESSYNFRIVFRADEVEVFDPETNTWVKYKNKKRLINNSNSKRFFNKLTPLIGDNKKTENIEKLEIDTSTKTESNYSALPTNPFELVDILKKEDTIDEALESFSSLEEGKKDTVPKKDICTRTEYREEYIPGTKSNPGYVRSYEVEVEIPCGSQSQDDKPDYNDCNESSVIGGLLGTGIALSSNKGKDRFWALPAGGPAGALIGCQVDGG